jgi:hypothetical protein
MEEKHNTINLAKITYISQPNSITNSKQDLNLLQQRIRFGIIKELQNTMRDIYNKKVTLEQLLLFDEIKEEKTLHIEIKLSDIYHDNTKYKEVREALKTIAATPIEINYINSKNEEIIRFTHLFDIEFNKGKYINKFKLSIPKIFAQQLLDLTKGYTKYGYEVAIESNNKYIPILYTLLSSWKTKGGYKINIAELVELLNCPKSYATSFKDLNKRVLVPGHEYLKNVGDIFFEYSFDSKTKIISFKIVDRNSNREALVINKFIELLTRMNLNQQEIDNIMQFRYTNFEIFNSAMQNILLYVNENSNKINSKYNYIHKALEKAFKV